MITSKNEIVDIAARLFMIYGYKGCRTVEVAELAGLSNNSGLFRYFKTKAEMYRTVVERYVVNMQMPKEKFGDYTNLSLKGFIEYYVDCVGKSMVNVHAFVNADNRTANRYFWFMLDCAYRDAESAQSIIAFGEEEIELFEKVIEKAKQSGEIRPDVDVQKIAKLFRYAFVGLSYTFAMKNGVTTDQIREELYDIYNLIKS
jgi:AcrR family transcriptional regulator